MNRIIEKYRRFMYNRNGIDRLCVFLLIAGMLVKGTGSFIPVLGVRIGFSAAAALIIAFAVYRALSKNLYRRPYEEDRFNSFMKKLNLPLLAQRIRAGLRHLTLRLKQIRTHRFRTCPACGEFLRLSMKRGKRSLTCPRCGKHFTVRIIF